MAAQSNFHTNPEIINKILEKQNNINKYVVKNNKKSEEKNSTKNVIVKLFPNKFETVLVETSTILESGIEKQILKTAILDPQFFFPPEQEYRKYLRLQELIFKCKTLNENKNDPSLEIWTDYLEMKWKNKIDEIFDEVYESCLSNVIDRNEIKFSFNLMKN